MTLYIILQDTRKVMFMKKWLPITGNFSEQNEKIVFCGGIWQPPNRLPSENFEPIGQAGILLFEDNYYQ